MLFQWDLEAGTLDDYAKIKIPLLRDVSLFLYNDVKERPENNFTSFQNNLILGKADGNTYEWILEDAK